MSVYRGPSRRLILSFDVGTTYSGISYCVLDPGFEPKNTSVTRFPGQEHIASSSKIPTALYYDRDGHVRATGAESELDQTIEQAEDEDWIKVQWFKLRLRPQTMKSPAALDDLPRLPPDKHVGEVLSDFLRYLFSCAESFIIDSQPTVARGWPDLRRTATFVIAQPNGWEGAQQTVYREAAIKAGLVPDTPEGRSRIVFVSEGEASLHYCLLGRHVDDIHNGFIVADLGGGTLDFSAYRLVGVNPLRVEEMAAARCELQGSALVTERAKEFITKKLQSSPYGQPANVDNMSTIFDQITKRTFRGPTETPTCFVTFGTHMDKDVANDIRSGRLKLHGEQVAKFFDPSIDCAMNAILEQVREAPIRVSVVYLVGGFSASPYVVAQMKQRLLQAGINVQCPDGQTIKAVADGSVSYFIEHYVTSRVAKATYMVRYGVQYDKHDPTHVRKKHEVQESPSGRKRLFGRLGVVLRRGTAVQEEKEYRKQLVQEVQEQTDLEGSIVGFRLMSYVGPDPVPDWVDEVPTNASLRPLCTIAVPVSALQPTIQAYISSTADSSGRKAIYKAYTYELVLRFGGTEMLAQLAWKENGIEHRSPAEIVYENSVDFTAEDDDEVGSLTRTMDKLDTT